MGIEAIIDGRDIFAGNGRLMDKAGIRMAQLPYKRHGYPYFRGERLPRSHCNFRRGKPDSKEAIADLKALGIAKTVMLTGDRREIAEAVGRELGLDEVHAELMPDGKVRDV